jgi:hypothetical protein
VNRVEAHLGYVFGGRLDVDLAVDRIAALEADHLAGFDSEGGVETRIPGSVDVLLAVAQSVIDGVVALARSGRL